MYTDADAYMDSLKNKWDDRAIDEVVKRWRDRAANRKSSWQ